MLIPGKLYKVKLKLDVMQDIIPYIPIEIHNKDASGYITGAISKIKPNEIILYLGLNNWGNYIVLYKNILGAIPHIQYGISVTFEKIV